MVPPRRRQERYLEIRDRADQGDQRLLYGDRARRPLHPPSSALPLCGRPSVPGHDDSRKAAAAGVEDSKIGLCVKQGAGSSKTAVNALS